MTPTEAVRLVKFVGARCPAMRMQDDTPEAWYVDLVGYDLPDALEAARRVTLTKAFISIGDLVGECDAIVRHRIGAERLAERQAQIAAENAGDADLAPVTTGGPGTPLALTAGPLRQRLPDVQAGRREARDRYQAIREEQAERDAVRKLDAEKRAEVEAELDALRRRDEPRENTHA